MKFLALPLLFICRLSSILLAAVALSIVGFQNVSLLIVVDYNEQILAMYYKCSQCQAAKGNVKVKVAPFPSLLFSAHILHP